MPDPTPIPASCGYYGSAVPAPVGFPGVQRPLVDIDWCDEAGCPRDKCIGCQKQEAHR